MDSLQASLSLKIYTNKTFETKGYANKRDGSLSIPYYIFRFELAYFNGAVKSKPNSVLICRIPKEKLTKYM